MSAEPLCEPGDLAVTVRWEPDGSGGLRGQVVAENVGSRACRLPGKPAVAPVGADGTPLPVQTVVTLEWVQPGYVILQPGQRATAPVFWLSWSGQPASDQARVGWGAGGDRSTLADVHGPLQPECAAGRPDNLSSSWFRLADLPGSRSTLLHHFFALYCRGEGGAPSTSSPTRPLVRWPACESSISDSTWPGR
jgi:hypothetical protein